MKTGMIRKILLMEVRMGTAAELLFQSLKEMKGSTTRFEAEHAKLIRKLDEAGFHSTALVVRDFPPAHSAEDWFPVFNSQIATLIGALHESQHHKVKAPKRKSGLSAGEICEAILERREDQSQRDLEVIKNLLSGRSSVDPTT
ncbi:hypothetical protein ACSFCW_09460 [Yokenella regensburgei]|uniref:hypothetical protein n=1 Tax=Yokenella regensburgei TaxID=158877 RepID=UPI003EDA4E13